MIDAPDVRARIRGCLIDGKWIPESATLAVHDPARDIGRIRRVAEAIETEMVDVNAGLISTEVAPFGGVKASGLGREGSHHGQDDFMEHKYVCMGL